MRILLAANASYVPPRGGATRSNLVWLQRLAAAGHACRVVAAVTEDAEDRLEQLREEGIDAPVDRGDGVGVSRNAGVLIYSVASHARRTQVLRREVREFQPDWLLVSSEDVGHILLREAHQSAPGRVVYLAHTPQFFPFGPASWNSEPQGDELLARAAGVVAIGKHMAEYIERYAGCRAEVIHPPVYGDGPFRLCGSFDQGLVTMINPCAVKGITIFLELARRFPQVAFGALPGWGTTTADRRAMDELSNVTLLPNCRNIEEALVRTRVLLAPSLWYEGFGLSAMEAMLRGVPVMASDSGGLPEAKSGTSFVIPVRPIERFEPIFDERGMPKPVLAEQDVTPWANALEALLTQRDLYERESCASREAGLRFVAGLRPQRLEEYLLALEPSHAGAPGGSAGLERAQQVISSLSPEKRALLVRRLRQRGPGAG